MKLIDKEHINELKKLYNDIDNCIGDLVVARGRRDDTGIAAAHWQMETLMVNTQQTISYIFENPEEKDVNLEKELDEWMRYGPHTNYPWCTIPDAIKITAEHFFELGLKAQKG